MHCTLQQEDTSDWGTRGVKEGEEEKVGRSRSVRVKVEEVELGSERATQTDSSPRAVASLVDHRGGLENCASQLLVPPSPIM